MHGSGPIQAFVQSLVEARPPAEFRNPYQQGVAAHNLEVFLSSRDPEVRTILLVGEAPGYRGAAISGVALTSTAILVDPWENPWDAFGPGSGFISASGFSGREATATIVWSGLASTFPSEPLPLTWNAVPFHPARDNGTNASLARKRLELGREWLERIIDLFPRSVPISLGKRADEALSTIGVEHVAVRHPSRGGKPLFLAGLAEVRQKLKH